MPTATWLNGYDAWMVLQRSLAATWRQQSEALPLPPTSVGGTFSLASFIVSRVRCASSFIFCTYRLPFSQQRSFGMHVAGKWRGQSPALEAAMQLCWHLLFPLALATRETTPQTKLLNSSICAGTEYWATCHVFVARTQAKTLPRLGLGNMWVMFLEYLCQKRGFACVHV